MLQEPNLLQLATGLSPLLLLLVSQEAPQNLPRWRFGDLVDELNSACNPLVPRLVCFHVLLYVALDDTVTLLEAY